MIDYSLLLDGIFEEACEISKEDRATISSELFRWVSTVAKKRPVSDLPVRLEKLHVKIDEMVDQTTFKVTDGNLIVDVVGSGSGNDTFKALSFGSDWFEGHPDIAAFIAKILFLRE